MEGVSSKEKKDAGRQRMVAGLKAVEDARKYMKEKETSHREERLRMLLELREAQKCAVHKFEKSNEVDDLDFDDSENPYLARRQKEIDIEVQKRKANLEKRIDAKKNSIKDQIVKENTKRLSRERIVFEADKKKKEELAAIAQAGERRDAEYLEATAFSVGTTATYPSKKIKPESIILKRNTLLHSTSDSVLTTVADTLNLSFTARPETAVKKADLSMKPLSKFEQNCLYKAQERQRHRLYHGTKDTISYLAKPAVIQFHDYEAGKKYTQKIQLTNVAAHMNQFRILTLTQYPQIKVNTEKDLGRMSAGTSSYIYVSFTPHSDQGHLGDFDLQLEILAKIGGIFTIPIQCRTKKMIPAFSFDALDFGSLQYGQTQTKELSLKNLGAAPFTFVVDQFAKPPFHIVLPEDTSVAAYADTKLILEFNLTKENGDDDEKRQEVDFQFICHSSSQTSIKKSIYLKVTGLAIPAPIYLTEKIIDLGFCLYDKLYRRKLLLKNRNTIAINATAHIPKKYKDCIEYSPKFGFVQPVTGLELYLNFKATSTIEENEITMPISFAFSTDSQNDAKSVHYIYYTLRFRLVQNTQLVLSPNCIDLSTIYTNSEQVIAPVKIKNESVLTQQFGFSSIDSEMSIEPSTGILLPQSEQMLRVALAPKDSTRTQHIISVYNSFDQHTSLKLKYQCLEPALHFSHSSITFQAIAPGTRAHVSVVVSRGKKEEGEHFFHFGLPAQSHLYVKPQSLLLRAGDSRKLEISYEPPSTLDLSALHGEQQDWLLSCSTENLSSMTPMYLDIKTTLIEAELRSNVEILDFGQIAVGEGLTQSLKFTDLRKTAKAPLTLREDDGLNCTGPFSIVNAWRPAPHTALVRFEPSQSGAYSEELSVYCPELGQRLIVQLRGEGVMPSLVIEEPALGIVDCGRIVIADGTALKNQRTIRLRNGSDIFPVKYRIDQSHPLPPDNSDGTSPFLLIPNEATVEAGGTISVEVIFQPDRPRHWPLITRFKLSVGEAESSALYFTLLGWCHDFPIYISKDDQALDQPHCIEDHLRPSRKLTRPPSISHEFPKDGGSLELSLGCCLGNHKSGSFQIEFVTDNAKLRSCLSATPERGSSLTAGAITRVKISFKSLSAQQNSKAQQDENDSILSGLTGSWVSATARFQLVMGGESRINDVRLRAYMRA